MDRPAKILVVDDVATNVDLLEAVLAPRGYEVLGAQSGVEALALVSSSNPDLVLLDVEMPGMNGYEVCQRLRDQSDTRFLPVVMVTAVAQAEKIRALEVGADDFIRKPFEKEELLARVKSLLRLKRYHDTVEAQARELLELNRTLESRVAAQVEELNRLARLRRFLSPQVADLVLASGDGETILASHRREIAVLFCDLRGFTAFSGGTEPEEVMEVLGEFHRSVGELVPTFEATVGHFAGDGLMLFFNDPVRCDDPAGKAVSMAISLNERVDHQLQSWRRRGHDLGFGIGVDLGYATLGRMGFEGRYDYGAIGNVVNLASRLCDQAKDGEILISQRVYASVADRIDVGGVDQLWLKGFDRAVSAWNVAGHRRATTDE